MITEQVWFVRKKITSVTDEFRLAKEIGKGNTLTAGLYVAHYTDNDSWSTNEISLDWQAAALYGFHFARWIAHAPPASR